MKRFQPAALAVVLVILGGCSAAVPRGEMPLDTRVEPAQPLASAGWVTSSLVAATAPKPAGVGKWQKRVDVSELDGERTCVLEVTAKRPVPGWLRSAVPKLVVFHSAKASGLYIFSKILLHTNGGYAPARLRFDGGPVEELQMYSNHNSDAYRFGDIEPGRLLNHDSLKLEVVPFRAGLQIAEFDIRGFANARTWAAQQCGTPPAS